VKALTGCDPITARFMRAEFFTFEPVAKYWLAVNHKPSVADDSHGFWRRVRLIPFTHRFSGAAADQSLADTLQLELPGILAWAVRGVLAWQERGLPAPAAVYAATETYRLESDPLAAFIEERCLVAEGVSVASSQAFKAYVAWGHDQGMRERELLTSTLFGVRMAERFEKRHGSSGNRYLGVALLSDRDEPREGDLVKRAESPPASEDDAREAEVKGSVKGCESGGRENEVHPIEMSLTRSNPENAFTTLHPVTVRRSAAGSRPICKRCGSELSLVATSNLCEGCRSDAVPEFGGAP
jgi:phage/plasmid-associated DNA primase